MSQESIEAAREWRNRFPSLWNEADLAEFLDQFATKRERVARRELVAKEKSEERLREALEYVATYLETQNIEHSPDCSYGETVGPHGDFCDCGLSARRHKRSAAYKVIQHALSSGSGEVPAHP